MADFKVGQLIYEVTSKIGSGFSSSIKKAEADVNELSDGMIRAKNASRDFEQEARQLADQFSKGKITLGEYNTEIAKLSKANTASKNFSQLSGEQKKLTTQFQKGKISLTQYEAQMKATENRAKIFTSRMQAMKLAATAFFAALAFQALRKFGELLKKSVKDASDLAESVNAVSVVFKDSAKGILELGEKSAKSVGLSKIEFNALAVQLSGFTSQLTGNGKTIVDVTDEMTTRIADFASVMNLDVAEAGQIFQSTLAGQTEPIRRFGKDVSAVAVEQYALANGLVASKTEMTESIKVQARYGLLMQQTADTAGDFANTSDSLANSQRILGAQMKDNSASFGEQLVPSIKTTINEFRNLIKGVDFGGEGFQKFGQILFSTTNVIIAIVKAIGASIQISGLLRKSVVGLGKVFITSFKDMAKSAGGLGEVLKFLVTGRFKKAKEALKELDFSETRDAFKGFGEDIVGQVDKITNSTQSIGDSLKKAFDPQAYEDAKESIELAISAQKALEEQSTKTGESTEASSEDIKKFNDELKNTQEEATKTKNALNDDLNKAFDEFGENLSKTVAETNKGLAEITLKAEQEAENLRNSIKETDDSDTRDSLQAQLDEVESVLDAREGYEQRHAERVLQIRAKLEEAGIDPNSAGLESLTSERDLEAEIEEQRRLASLDEFTRFEEQQASKLILLTDNFIAETTIIKQKIETQKTLESELTAFLESTNSQRADAVVSFVDTSISKYRQMGVELEKLIKLQGELGGGGSGGGAKPQFHTGGYVDGKGGEVHAGEYVIPASMVKGMNGMITQLEGMRTGGTTISPTINISDTMGRNVSTEELVSRLGYEMNKIR